jgi:hypothetical protein
MRRADRAEECVRKRPVAASLGGLRRSLIIDR